MGWPRWVYGAHAWLRALIRGRHADDDLREELSLHVELQARENMRRGMSEAEAWRRARIGFGGMDAATEASRDIRPLQTGRAFVQDVRYALRLVRRAPGFATVMVLTIALGIGANTAIFSIVNGVLLRPLPYVDADRLVRIYLTNPAQDITDGPLSVPEVRDWNSRARAVSAISGAVRVPMILTGEGEPTEHQAAIVAGDVFGTLRVPARIGRTLTDEDHRLAFRNAVISDRLWTTRFGRDPGIVGRRIVVGNLTYSVVGVMPPGFGYPASDVDFWTPESVLPDESLGPRVRSQRVFDAIARLSPGATLLQADDDVNSMAAQLAKEFPNTNKGWSAARVVPLRTTIVGEVDRALWVVLGVVAIILLIACANLANLLLARGTARSHELATRVALGAGRFRIARQLLTESLVLALLGGGLGIGLAVWGVKTVLPLSADTLPRVDDVRVDWGVIAFGLGLTALTSLLFGILPAVRAARVDPQLRLRGGRGSVGGGRLRPLLVVAQVALAIILVIGAGLMTRSFLQLRSVHPGFEPANMLAVTIQYNLAGASGDIGQHLLRRREEILQRLSTLPGVVAAGSITRLPLEDDCSDTLIFLRADGTGSPDGAPLRAPNCVVSAGYIKAMGIPLLRGEPLPESWPAGAPSPFLVSEAAARRFWPGQDPLGQVLRANYGGRAVVVGVVGDVRQHGLGEDAPPVVYFNHRTAPRAVSTIVLRTTGDPLLLTTPIRAVVREIDANQPIRRISTLSSVMSESIARDRFFTLLFALFGLLALALAAVGVYGVLAYSVGQRTREIGVRMALGAEVRTVMTMVLRQGMQLVVSGVAIGAVASMLLTRLLSSQLHGISATDPVTFALAASVLLVVALVACYVPARRATRVRPVTALRAE